MHRRVLLIGILLLAAPLTGCLGEDSPTPDTGNGSQSDAGNPPWYVNALGDGHNHTDRSAHENLSTPNFETIGHAPLVTGQDGTSPGGSSCGDIDDTNGNATVGAQKAGDSRGVIFSDFSNPHAPTKLGELWLTFTHIYDVSVVPGGDYATLITSQPKQGPTPNLPTPSASQPAGYWHNACTGETTPVTFSNHTQDPVPRPSSLLLVDLTDPENPTIVDQRPVAGLGHGVYSKTVDERTWIVGITENLAHGGRHFYFNQLTQTPTGPIIEPLSTYVAQPNPDHADYLGGHSDAWIHVHPETGQTLAYLSAGPQVEILNVSNPNTPTPVSTWTDIGPNDPGDHNLHSLHPLDTMWNGTHYTIVGPELTAHPGDTPSGIVWVLDTTDPANPQAVAAWTLPTNVTWEGTLQFSTHYMTVVNQTLFVSMYHGGVWAIDLANATNGTPETIALLDSIGAYVPADPAPRPPSSYSYSWTPNLEEVLHAGNGLLVTFDANSGIYTFRFNASDPMPAPDPWPIQPP